MAEVTIKYYICDICNSQFTNASRISVLTLPASYHITKEGRHLTTLESLDVCDECCSVLHNLIWNNFAEISSTISGVKSLIKYDKEVKKRKVLNEGT